MRTEDEIRDELTRLETSLQSPELKQNYTQWALTQGKIAALQWVLEVSVSAARH